MWKHNIRQPSTQTCAYKQDVANKREVLRASCGFPLLDCADQMLYRISIAGTLDPYPKPVQRVLSDTQKYLYFDTVLTTSLESLTEEAEYEQRAGGKNLEIKTLSYLSLMKPGHTNHTIKQFIQ